MTRTLGPNRQPKQSLPTPQPDGGIPTTTARQPEFDDLGGEPRSFDLRDYALIIRRHAALIVVLAVLGTMRGET